MTCCKVNFGNFAAVAQYAQFCKFLVTSDAECVSMSNAFYDYSKKLFTVVLESKFHNLPAADK